MYLEYRMERTLRGVQFVILPISSKALLNHNLNSLAYLVIVSSDEIMKVKNALNHEVL